MANSGHAWDRYPPLVSRSSQFPIRLIREQCISCTQKGHRRVEYLAGTYCWDRSSNVWPKPDVSGGMVSTRQSDWRGQCGLVRSPNMVLCACTRQDMGGLMVFLPSSNRTKHRGCMGLIPDCPRQASDTPPAGDQDARMIMNTKARTCGCRCRISSHPPSARPILWHDMIGRSPRSLCDLANDLASLD